ncbi:hypothetical protein DPMN_043173 [Dreissena polymorpha]|nr:hypothetical protein DPMN_043173 [Dreissena polymorpha]
MNTSVKQLTQKTSALMRLSPDLLFVGVYSAITFQPLALMDRENVQINRDNNGIDFENFHIAITSNQIRAIIAHIVSSSSALTRIDVAGLNFLCLRLKSNASLTGTSNFNVDHHNRKCLQESCDHLYEVTGHHFSIEDLEKHPLPIQMSAMLKYDCVVVGLCNTTSSSLKLVQEIVEQPMEDPTFPKQQDDRREQQSSRGTEFCEDWHTATFQSVKAFKMIGSFTSFVTKESDKSPLTENIVFNVVADE